MGEKEEEDWSQAKRIVAVLAVAFAILSVTITGFVLAAEGTFSVKHFIQHDSIYIDGNADFGLLEGVTAGSGTEADPFVIEGWIIGGGISGISINDTDAHVLIRNISLSGTWTRWEKPDNSTGISLQNASNVKIESSFISGFRTGILANGALGVTVDIEISRCAFTSTGQNVDIRRTNGCVVTHSFFNDYDKNQIRISNCTSVSCSYNSVKGTSYTYLSYLMSVVLIENVSSCELRDNSVWANSDSSSVRLSDTINATVTNNSVRSYSGYGLVAERCTDLTLSRNEISSGEGIRIQGGMNAVVNENYVHSGLYRSGSLGISASNYVDATISENLLINGGGIVVSYSRDCVVKDNYVEGAGYFGNYGYMSPMTGMSTYGCQNLTITRNLFANGSGPGLAISGTDITVDGNVISNNYRMESYFTDDGRGISATGSDLSIRNNSISSNSFRTGSGVKLDTCDNSIFEGNNVSDDVEFRYSDNLEVSSNNFNGEWNFSVLSWTDVTTLEKNNFAVGIGVSSTGDPSIIHWDSGYPEGGNYWQSYSGDDLKNGPNQNLPGSDGFIDTAYQISTVSIDNYPRVEPFRVLDSKPPVTFAICNGTLGLRSWFISNVSVALIAFDNNSSSVYSFYRLDSGPWNAYSSRVLVTGDGSHTIQFRSVDGDGNEESAKSFQIRVDTQAPFLTSSISREYEFRTRMPDTLYVEASFQDGTSGVDYSLTTYNSTIFGYPNAIYSASDWNAIIPSTGTANGTIQAVDMAGNSYTTAIKIKASVAPNTNPLSHKGPYGWWLIIATLVDAGIGLAVLGGYASSQSEALPGGKWTPRDEGERHYDEDVVDGYPKFKRQV